MTRALAILLVCQLAGTVIQQASGLPVPGAVLGLVMLLVWLVRTGGPSPALHGTAQGLLRYLGLLFVPAGVGVVSELPAIEQNGLALAIAIPVSTLLGLLVTGLLMQFFLRRQVVAETRADA